jgi:TonB-linked SusC/RagA family outer membrane protein
MLFNKMSMKKKIVLMLACLLCMCSATMAQTRVTGTVINSSDNEPVIGASVVVKGTHTGIQTDARGRFSLNVPSGARTLVVSCVGMKTEDVTIRPNMKIFLEEDKHSVDEVMVVAYGTAKKSAFTGSAGVVKSDEIGKIQVSNPVDALTGKVTGIQLYNNTGQPGQTSPSILIRGISSINAGTSPLIILDGAPFDGDLNTLNTQDIESMTILKDAASAALYGARGANGVIIITTKSGRENRSTVTVDAKWGSNSRAIPDYKYVTSPAKYYETWYLGLDNYAKNKLGYTSAQAAAFANANLTANNDYGLGYNVYTVPNGEYMIGSNGKLNPNATLGRVVSYNGNQYLLTPDDWVDASYNNSLRQEYSVSASNNTDKSTFYASANYLDNEGITKSSNYKRFTGRMKVDNQIKDWLKIGGNFSYAHYNSDYLNKDDDGASGSSGNVFALTTVAPIYPLYIRDGQGNIIYNENAHINMYDYGDGSVNGQIRPYISQANPLSSNQLDVHNNEGNAFNGVGTAEIRFLKDFKFTSTNTVMVDETRTTDTTNPFFGQYAASNGVVYKYHTRTWAYNYQQLLSWTHSFGSHNVDLMLGHEYYRNRYYFLYGYKSNQFSVHNTELAGAVVLGSTSSYTTDYNTEGYFGRAQYNYDNKYFASMSYRRDASSHFDPDHRWGNFWSFGAAWIISKENFFKNLNANWVDELKFKASYGEQGNDRIGNYLYTTTYNIANSNGAVSLVPSSLGNKSISWEKGGNFNTGFDFAMFKNRLSGSLEYFYRKTTDMLFYFPLPPSYGYTGYYDNIGDMRNSGVELELNGTIIKTQDLQWDAHLNFTAYKNKITRLPDERKTMTVDGVDGYSSGSYYYGEGKSLYTFYMHRYAGVDKETGEALYYKDTYEKDAEGNVVKDAKGNPVVNGETTTTNPNEATYHLCGTALPKAYGGFGTAVSYKGFDLSVDFTYQLGGKVYDSSYASSMAISRGGAIHADLLNSWSETNKNSNIPRIQYNDSYTNAASDRFLTSAAYLTFQNFNVGYTLPRLLTNRIGIQKVRLYVTGDNLWVWSKRQGLDPRQSISGSNSASYYAPIRTISGGITVTL